ncbi:MAG: NAD-dependent epimerase/dehydratase family protein [Rubrivivax sp.]
MTAAPELPKAPPGAVALVTGGAGFIGSHLCATLAHAGMAVHSVSRREQPAGSTAGSPAVRHHRADLADFTAVQRLLDTVRPDYVFHLASHVQGAPDLAHVLPAFHGNLETTVNLLTAVAGRGCRRVVLTGSFMEPAATAGDLTPTSPYAAAKWAASAYARMFAALYAVPVTTARVFMVYGPGQQDLTKLVPYTIGRLLRGQAPQISSGRRLIDWIYVDDVAEGFLRLALADGAVGRTVDLGSGTLIATADLVTKICRLVAPSIAPELGALPDRPLEPTGAARINDSLRTIGWSPRVGLDEGLMRTVDFYRHSAPA